MVNKKYMKIGQVADYMHVSTSTVRYYANTGQLPYTTTPKGHRIFLKNDVDEFLGKNDDNKRHVFYARSSKGDKSSITSQLEELREEYGDPTYEYKDNGSGLNENRKSLNKMIRDAQKDKFDIIYVTHFDRLSRFGNHYLQLLFKEYDVEIIALHDDKKSSEEELMSDFMNLIASFAGKFYRLRSKKAQKDLLYKAEVALEGGSD